MENLAMRGGKDGAEEGVYRTWVYELVANWVFWVVRIVSHVGKNTSSGNCVCHALVDQGQGQSGKWIITNDSNEALSKAPPKEGAYLFLFERI